jgi:protein-arginine kinase activator protein McsA
MEYKKGDKVIKFGCAEIYYGMLVSLSRWGKEHRGNRMLKSITLNSGVTMTIDEINKVLEYRKYVMENT